MINSIDHIYKSSFISKIALLILFFIYMFSIQFVFVPGGLGTRALTGIFGLILFFIDKLPCIANVIRIGKFDVNKYQFSIGLSLFAIVTLAFAVNMIHGTSERTFISYPVSMILIIAGAYLVCRLAKAIYRILTFEIIANYVVGSVLLQVYIALTMFFSPEIKQIISNIVIADDITLDMLMVEDGFRLLGFGVVFFTAGIVNSFTLILICFFFKEKERSKLRVMYLTFAFVSILVLGMMMSRTTIVGAGLGLGMLVLNVKSCNCTGDVFKYLIYTLLILFILVLIVVKLMPEDQQYLLNNATEYGFEMFYNYFENGELSTASSDQLKNMYHVLPQTVKTWLLGDGFFADPITEGYYYKGIDVGYSRLIFYFGITGLAIFLFYQFSMLWYINHRTGGRYLKVLILIYVLVLVGNMKGFTDLTYLFALLFFLTPQFNNENG